MDWKQWGPGGVLIFTLIVGHKAPLDSVKHLHTHVEIAPYMHVNTTGGVVIPGRRNFSITPGTGTLVTEGQAPTVQVNPI